jgi:hypothetical protein
MIVSRWALLVLGVLWAAPGRSQFARRSGPCIDLPEPGSLLETHAVSRVERAGSGVFRYFWRLTVGPGSRRTIMNVSIGDSVGQFTAPPNWGALTSVSTVDRRGGVMFSTLDVVSDANDLKAQNSYEFRALSDHLPAPALAIIYPRRATCEPTDEEWPALEKKGWTAEKFKRLHTLELYTNREIVIGPVFAGSESEGEQSRRFAMAMKGLSDLEEYLSFMPNGGPSRKIPRPPQDTRGFEGLSMQDARKRAIERAGSRTQDVAVIEALYRFYLGPQQ